MAEFDMPVADAPAAGADAKRSKAPRDIREELTEKFVAALEQGEIPWAKPWQTLDHGLPRNMHTGREYSGGNRLMLMLAQLERGYADPRFATFEQIKALGGKVNKGERGMPIEVWKDEPFWGRKDVEVLADGKRVKVFGEGRGGVDVGPPGAEQSQQRVSGAALVVRHGGEELSWRDAHTQLDRAVARAYVVFNAEQCSDLKLEPLAQLQNVVPPNERAESIIEAMRHDGVRFGEHPKFAFYSPKTDKIAVPPRAAFESAEGYYGTVLHEIGHATGAEKRLNRGGITAGHRFGSEGYAREELRAEMFSTFMAAQTGIPHDETQHVAYVQPWAKLLKGDKHEIFRAAADASRAVEYVLVRERDLVRRQTLGLSADVSSECVEQVERVTAMAAERGMRSSVEELQAEHAGGERVVKVRAGHGAELGAEVLIDEKGALSIDGAPGFDQRSADFERVLDRISVQGQAAAQGGGGQEAGAEAGEAAPADSQAGVAEAKAQDRSDAAPEADSKPVKKSRRKAAAKGVER